MRFAELAAQCGLPVPATIRSSEIVDVEDLMGKVSLPCVLKPNVHIGWFQSQAIKDGGGLPRKVLHAQSQEDLRTLYEQIRQFTTDFVVQKYVPGGPDCVYSFHAYYNRRSEPMAYFVGRKIRSYPIDAGESTYIETVDEPEVVQLGLRILGALKFVGPVKLDFKKDWERNRFYLLEINARYNLWHYLGATCGINIPRSAYADLTGRQCSPATGYRAGLRWLSFSDDCRAFVRSYRPNGYLTLWQWLWSYRHPKIYNVFSWSDPYPLCVASFNWLKSKFLRPSVPTS
jgi:predicted ATP-grasp superfamily ATP-dependent carboligase